ncbi:glycosyltransferase family 2 protein [Candidatus Hydrogenedentota bacterium]
MGWANMRWPDPILDVSISIANTNNKDLLRECLRSLHATPPVCSHEIIVVDNASTDGSPGMVREEFPSVKLVACTQRRVFARNHNIGFMHARGRYFLPLNEDTLVPEGTIDRMFQFIDENPRFGEVGCRTVSLDGSVQRTAYRFQRPLSYLLKQSFLDRLLPLPYSITLHYQHEPPLSQEVESVTGVCFIMPSDLYREVGGLDEGFHQLGDDYEICYKARKAGYGVYYLADVQIEHHYGKSTSSYSYIYHSSLGFLYFSRKHNWHKKGMWASIAAVNLGKLPLRLIQCVFMPGSKLLRSKVAGHFDVLLYMFFGIDKTPGQPTTLEPEAVPAEYAKKEEGAPWTPKSSS